MAAVEENIGRLEEGNRAVVKRLEGVEQATAAAKVETQARFDRIDQALLEILRSAKGKTVESGVSCDPTPERPPAVRRSNGIQIWDRRGAEDSGEGSGIPGLNQLPTGGRGEHGEPVTKVWGDLNAQAAAMAGWGR